jgi:anti-anti-sigma factor
LIKLTIESREGLIIIYLFGELVAANFHDIEEDLAREIEKKPRLIALNFEDMEDIDSTGIGYLVKVRTKALENDIGLILCGIPIRILELLCIAGMDHLFTIMSKEDFTEEYLVEK